MPRVAQQLVRDVDAEDTGRARGGERAGGAAPPARCRVLEREPRAELDAAGAERRAGQPAEVVCR